jgi:biotin carboxyl carrier protein
MIYKVRLNDKIYEVDVTEGEASLLNVSQEQDKSAPLAASIPSSSPAVVRTVQSGVSVIKSPLPGTVLAIKVSVGDSLKAGQIVAVIEAMKMENEIVAVKSGKVSHIHVVKGAQVSTGSPLIDFV